MPSVKTFQSPSNLCGSCHLCLSLYSYWSQLKKDETCPSPFLCLHVFLCPFLFLFLSKCLCHLGLHEPFPSHSRPGSSRGGTRGRLWLCNRLSSMKLHILLDVLRQRTQDHQVKIWFSHIQVPDLQWPGIRSNQLMELKQLHIDLSKEVREVVILCDVSLQELLSKRNRLCPGLHAELRSQLPQKLIAIGRPCARRSLKSPCYRLHPIWKPLKACRRRCWRRWALAICSCESCESYSGEVFPKASLISAPNELCRSNSQLAKLSIQDQKPAISAVLVFHCCHCATGMVGIHFVSMFFPAPRGSWAKGLGTGGGGGGTPPYTKECPVGEGLAGAPVMGAPAARACSTCWILWSIVTSPCCNCAVELCWAPSKPCTREASPWSIPEMLCSDCLNSSASIKWPPCGDSPSRLLSPGGCSNLLLLSGVTLPPSNCSSKAASPSCRFCRSPWGPNQLWPASGLPTTVSGVVVGGSCGTLEGPGSSLLEAMLRYHVEAGKPQVGAQCQVFKDPSLFFHSLSSWSTGLLFGLEASQSHKSLLAEPTLSFLWKTQLSKAFTYS